MYVWLPLTILCWVSSIGTFPALGLRSSRSIARCNLPKDHHSIVCVFLFILRRSKRVPPRDFVSPFLNPYKRIDRFRQPPAFQVRGVGRQAFRGRCYSRRGEGHRRHVPPRHEVCSLGFKLRQETIDLSASPISVAFLSSPMALWRFAPMLLPCACLSRVLYSCIRYRLYRRGFHQSAPTQVSRYDFVGEGRRGGGLRPANETGSQRVPVQRGLSGNCHKYFVSPFVKVVT